jgi:hypothetical protein
MKRAAPKRPTQASIDKLCCQGAPKRVKAYWARVQGSSVILKIPGWWVGLTKR